MDDIHGNLYYLPLPRQVELEEAVASRKYTAVCIGGARGGSKSRAWRMLAQRYCRKLKRFTVIFLRRELEPLRLNHLLFAEDEAAMLGARYVGMKMLWEENQSRIIFNHVKDISDYKNFIGAEADLLVFEQLEQFAEIQFEEIGAAVGRVERDDWRGVIGASENPNGPLSAFVDTIFVKKNPDREKYPDYDPADYHFLYSHLEDNPYVSKNYVKNLAKMSPEKRQMYRFGNRDVFPSQFFKTFNATEHVKALNG